MFIYSLGTSAKVTREVVRNSASTLSDVEDNDKTLNSDDNMDPLIIAESRTAQTATTGPPKTPASRKDLAAIVTEPKHTPASHFRTQATSSFGNMGEYMKVKMASEDKKSKVLEAKLQLDQAKFELDQEKAKTDAQKAKLDMAQRVMSMDGASEEVKTAANQFLLSLFT